MSDSRLFGHPARASVLIPLRDKQGKRMHAGFYDHYCIRKISGYKTIISMSEAQSTASIEAFIENDSNSLSLGLGKNADECIMPRVSIGLDHGGGFLFIPGRGKDDADAERDKHEQALVKDALLRGRPILAVCAGSWRLWETLGGKLKSVDDHCYSSMPYIKADGDLGNNVMVHCVTIRPNSMLDDMMKLKGVDKKDANKSLSKYPAVNSIHWMAPDPAKCPKSVRVVAKAIVDPKITINKRNQERMQPTADSVEAFERYGSPTMGVLWHFEAFYKAKPDIESKRHLNIVRYMAKAGDAYQAKQKMLQEYKSKVTRHSDKNSQINPSALFQKSSNHVNKEILPVMLPVCNQLR